MSDHECLICRCHIPENDDHFACEKCSSQFCYSHGRQLEEMYGVTYNEQKESGSDRELNACCYCDARSKERIRRQSIFDNLSEATKELKATDGCEADAKDVETIMERVKQHLKAVPLPVASSQRKRKVQVLEHLKSDSDEEPPLKR
jgi:hypothetical protein